MTAKVSEITPLALSELLKAGTDLYLLDVREQFERDIASIGGELIPVKQVQETVARIPKDRRVVVYCRSGGRSGKVCEWLLSQGYSQIENLAGGILAWSDQVDPSVRKY